MKINEKMKTIVLSSILLVLLGCQDFQNKKEADKPNIQEAENNISNDLSAWVAAINQKSIDSILRFYHAKSIKIISLK